MLLSLDKTEWKQINSRTAQKLLLTLTLLVRFQKAGFSASRKWRGGFSNNDF